MPGDQNDASDANKDLDRTSGGWGEYDAECRRRAVPKRIAKWHKGLGKIGHYVRHKPDGDDLLRAVDIYDFRKSRGLE